MKLVNKRCEVCGTLMENVVSCKKYCDNCKKKKAQSYNKNYYKNRTQLYNKENYINNFNDIIQKYKEPYILTTRGFSEVSEISAQSYACFFRENWYNLLTKWGQVERLKDYIKSEYMQYIEQTNDKSVERFIKNHKYVTQDTMKYFGSKDLKVACGVMGRNYTLQELEDNFFNIRKNLGRIPNITEFINLSNIHPIIYKKYYNLKGIIWDDIIRLFVKDEKEIECFYQERSEYISKITSENAQKEYVYSTEELIDELQNVFDNYYNKYNVYPSRRLFNKISKFHDFLYRKRFQMPWGKICEALGYEIDKNNHKSENICLGMIRDILHLEYYESQKTWNWLKSKESGYNLYVDGFYEKYNLVIEFDGIQHRKPVPNYGGIERFKKQVANDKTKDKLLKEYGYKLIRINSQSKWHDENYLKQLLLDNGINYKNINDKSA